VLAGAAPEDFGGQFFAVLFRSASDLTPFQSAPFPGAILRTFLVFEVQILAE
jgi:hypothetical protein